MTKPSEEGCGGAQLEIASSGGRFLRHGEAVPSLRRWGGPRPPPYRSDQPPTGYSSAGCSPAEPASASPAARHSEVERGGLSKEDKSSNKNRLDTASRFQRCASPPDPQRLQRRLHLRFRDYSQVIASRSGKFPDGDFRGACWLEGDFQQFWRIHRLAIRKGHLSFQIQVSTYLSWFPSSPSRV